MSRLHLPHTAIAILTAALLLGIAAPATDAWGMPSPRAYRPGGPVTLDTNLLSRSGTTAWAIDQYLAANTPLPALGAAFMAAETAYGVNAKFLLAAAMHESALGTSYIARVKHNLFGYNAYDRDPFRYATAYRTFAANIAATAKFIRDFYLTRSGRWWGGAPTLRSMQQFWSSSGGWGVSVSRVANSIRLAAIRGSSYTFATPAASGGSHSGDPLTLSLSWSGGAIPAGVTFVAVWEPVELDADRAAAVGASAAALAGSPGGVPTAGSLEAARPPVTVAASRLAGGARAVTLATKAPGQPGLYQLSLEMRDAGGAPLPSGQRVAIPSVPLRVWADSAVSVGVVPTTDGDGVTVQVTNTGRLPIPAAPAPAPDGRLVGEPQTGQDRSVVTVTASSASGDPAPILVLSAPLAADLLPGETATFIATGIGKLTGRSGNWLSADMSVLGDPTLLAAYEPAPTWVSDSGATGATMQGGTAWAGPSGPATASTRVAVPSGASLPMVAAVPIPAQPTTAGPAMPPPSGASAPTQIAAPAVAPAPASAPAATPTATPTPAAVRHITQFISERSAAVSYRGSWGSAAGPYRGGAVAYSTSAGATASLRFTGTQVSWVGPLGPTRGAAQVILDGRPVATVSLWRASFIGQATLFTRSFASAGPHTLTIRVLSVPGHPYVAIDGFTVRS